MPRLVVDDISTGYSPDHPVLNGLSLSVENGGRLALVGASGSGKTTLFRALAGFMDISAGQISVGNRLVSQPGLTLNPERRGVGLVFQDLALFPHMTVERNIRYGLRGLSATEASRRVDELLELTGLLALRDALPEALSGGQQQRVALARALAPRPGVLLLDEPFSSLDLETRLRLLHAVTEILDAEQMTALLVTHDQGEAFAFADEVAVIGGGRIEQAGSPKSLYAMPASREVARFIGEGSFLHAEFAPGEMTVETPFGAVIPRWIEEPPSVAERIEILIRPEDLSLALQGDEGTHVRVLSYRYMGSFVDLMVALDDGQQLHWHSPVMTAPSAGADVRVTLKGGLYPAFRQ